MIVMNANEIFWKAVNRARVGWITRRTPPPKIPFQSRDIPISTISIDGLLDSLKHEMRGFEVHKTTPNLYGFEIFSSAYKSGEVPLQKWKMKGSYQIAQANTPATLLIDAGWQMSPEQQKEYKNIVHWGWFSGLNKQERKELVRQLG